MINEKELRELIEDTKRRLQAPSNKRDTDARLRNRLRGLKADLADMLKKEKEAAAPDLKKMAARVAGP